MAWKDKCQNRDLRSYVQDCPESSSVVFFLQFISSLFHIKEIIVEWKFMVRFFQTNNVFTEVEARGLPSKRLNVCLMCLLFDISLEYILVC